MNHIISTDIDKLTGIIYYSSATIEGHLKTLLSIINKGFYEGFENLLKLWIN